MNISLYIYSIFKSIDVWRKLFPEENIALDELSERLEDYCLNQAMDEAKLTPLVNSPSAIPEGLAGASKTSALIWVFVKEFPGYASLPKFAPLT
ncbi:hypothetical protein [Moorena producens]|uniref:hypothetical protein n=1 Tax=Moorena producens TaxID=1155739 RepID=UPI003C79388C